MRLHVTQASDQQLADNEVEQLIGGPASQVVVNGNKTVVFGPEGENPDDTLAREAFEAGRIVGHGTQYR
ncbi:MAG: hypothetical protein H0V70_30380 [Ktedonobacteraceae bacterium]|jgi:hypothetical protein|nr:hypothetical protein [Ktedonobacteraceae bacterium]